MSYKYIHLCVLLIPTTLIANSLLKLGLKNNITNKILFKLQITKMTIKRVSIPHEIFNYVWNDQRCSILANCRYFCVIKIVSHNQNSDECMVIFNYIDQ